MTFRLFQIGFNKCATSALFNLFQKAGVPSLHSGGRYWRAKKHPAIVGHRPQRDIQDNIRAGRAPLAGLEDFQAFFDMEYQHGYTLIENFRRYDIFATAYPEARFILNIRDKDAWLRSRVRHHNGHYINAAIERTGLDHDAVIQMWSEDFDRHNAAVQDYFSDQRFRLLVFDIDRHDFKHLKTFVNPQVRLWPRHWKRHRVTDEVAKKLNWSAANG